MTELKLDTTCYTIAIWNLGRSRGILIKNMNHPVLFRCMDHRDEMLEEVQGLRMGIERLTGAFEDIGD